MTTPEVRRLAAALDPRPDDGLDTARTRASIDVKFAGANRPAGPAAEDPAVAQLYRGMREADSDIGRRIEHAALGAGHRLSATSAHELVAYAFGQTVSLHLGALQLTDPVARARLFGARNAYAVSYAELALRDVLHIDAPDIADRLVEALDSGLTDPALLVESAWDAPFPIVPS
ncbi:MAG: hypothetical protein KJ792_14975 [Actinobacteria bacterium]|nr:hypothetical protein [Actinomycetota bacterium]MCG2801188.1 hypothetical protein [Cellulomonas sp.]